MSRRRNGPTPVLALAAVGYCLSSLLLLSTCDAFSLVPKARSKYYIGPGAAPGEIIRARGYLAEDFHIQSKDGYKVRITRGRNPLINEGKAGAPGRVPILFIHGLIDSYNFWVVNSFDAKPSVLTNISFTNTPIEQLNAQLGDLPSAKSLPLLAMDCGHEVFIMSRRGFPGSQKLQGDHERGTAGKYNKTRGVGPVSAFIKSLMKNTTELAQQIRFSFDQKFWTFSLDEQARYDFPRVVDFVREQTGWNQISMVGYSGGGSLALGGMILEPELNKKLSAVILWASGLTLGYGDIVPLFAPLEPLLRAFKGAVPPTFIMDTYTAFWGLVCATRLAQYTWCTAIGDSFFGYSGFREPMKPEFINALYASTSHELAQALQMVRLDGKAHTFSHNLQETRPYDLSRITNTGLSFWVGATDTLTSPRDVAATLNLLKVPYRYHLIDAKFNHVGYYLHNNNSRLVIIPTLKEINELSRL